MDRYVLFGRKKDTDIIFVVKTFKTKFFADRWFKSMAMKYNNIAEYWIKKI